jgi:hypothetical protein
MFPKRSHGAIDRETIGPEGTAPMHDFGPGSCIYTMLQELQASACGRAVGDRLPAAGCCASASASC